MFIRNEEEISKLDVIWLEKDKGNILLQYFPEISRRFKNGIEEIAFKDSKDIRNKIKKIKI